MKHAASQIHLSLVLGLTLALVPSASMGQATGDLRGYWNGGKLTLAGRLLWERTLSGTPDYLFRQSLGGFRTTPGLGARIGLGRTGRVKLRVDYGKGKDESNLTVTFGESF